MNIVHSQLEDICQLAKSKFKIAIIAPTSLFYQVALFRDLSVHPKIDLMIYFCSDEGLTGQDITKKFNTDGAWGVEDELLRGYKYKFLRNYSPRPSYLNWPIGLVNLGIWNELRKNRPDAVVLMSWMNPTWWLAIMGCLRYKIPFFYLTDGNIQAEILKPGWKSKFNDILLRKILFKLASGFLCVGVANERFYRYYGVPGDKLVDFAFTWGYEDLLTRAGELSARREQLRNELSLSKESVVILFCGRLSPEKNPGVLLEAFERLELPEKNLLFVGDGKLRKELEDYTEHHEMSSVHFLGFRNRKEIAKYFAIADLLVVPSDREATGGVINEGMCFKLPVIVSDQVGFGLDLVQSGVNGFSFPVGDSEALARTILRFFKLSPGEKEAMGQRSLEIMTEWSRRDLGESLSQYMETLYETQAEPVRTKGR